MKKDESKKLIEKLKEIYEVIKEYGVIEYGASILELSQPQYAFLIETVKQLGAMADQTKLNCIIKGLSEDKNVETRMNELYTYVKQSKEHAFLVSDSFRKMMLSNSVTACCIMGIMLGDFTKENRNPTQYETIVMRALSLFTDYDIRNFDEMIRNNYIIETESGSKYIDIAKFPKDKKDGFMMTLDFCNQNRIFNYGSLVDGCGVVMDASIIDKVSELLFSYINRARRQMSYGIDDERG